MVHASSTRDEAIATPEPAPAPPPGRVAIADSTRLTAVVLAFLTILYALRVAPQIGRRLWFDELFTYYIAQEPTLPRLFDALIHTDLNPPLIYLLVRLFHTLFGTSELVTRLPATMAFYLGCVMAFVFLKRRIGVLWSAAAILLFWSTPYFKYATEARPYGLLIGFFSLVLISYDAAGRLNRLKRTQWAVPGITVGTIGMMLSHVFAPFSILPFFAAELVRTIKRRRIDWAIQASLLLPLTLSFIYLPATRNFQQIYFPESYQASVPQFLYFSLRLGFLYVFPGLFIAIALAFIAKPYSGARRYGVPVKWPEATWAAAILAVPPVLNLLLMRTGGAFWERYCITSALSFYILVVAALARLTGFRRSSAIAAGLVFCTIPVVLPRPADNPIAPSRGLESIRRDIPIVAGGGLTFLELDHYENSAFQSRLYYLVDRAAAIEYSHSTIFENMPLFAKYFPIHSHITPYEAFVRAHPHFLVLSRADFLEEWLLNKLCSDGARIKLTRSLASPSKDMQLYDVQLGS